MGGAANIKRAWSSWVPLWVAPPPDQACHLLHQSCDSWLNSRPVSSLTLLSSCWGISPKLILLSDRFAQFLRKAVRSKILLRAPTLPGPALLDAVKWGDCQLRLRLVCIGVTLIPRLHPMIPTVQSLAPYDVKSAGWPPLYPGYFGFILYKGRPFIFIYSPW